MALFMAPGRAPSCGLGQQREPLSDLGFQLLDLRALFVRVHRGVLLQRGQLGAVLRELRVQLALLRALRGVFAGCALVLFLQRGEPRIELLARHLPVVQVGTQLLHLGLQRRLLLLLLREFSLLVLYAGAGVLDIPVLVDDRAAAARACDCRGDRHQACLCESVRYELALHRGTFP